MVLIRYDSNQSVQQDKFLIEAKCSDIFRSQTRIILSTQQKTKVMIRLCKCAGFLTLHLLFVSA